MSDLFKFNLQRFGDVVYLPNKATEYVTLTAITPGDDAAEEGQFYWASDAASIASTFDGQVTVTASQTKVTVAGETEDDTKTYYTVGEITGIALPDNAGAGAITAGSDVGTVTTDDTTPATISGLGSATLTIGQTTLGFTNATGNVQILGGDTTSISEVDLETGSFAVTAEGGATGLYVDGTEAENEISINKPFTYTSAVIGSGDEAETVKTIDITGTGASIGATDGANTLTLPKTDAITIGGASLAYTVGADNASIDVSNGVGFFVQATGDKVVVPEALAAKAGNGFAIYEGSSTNTITIKNNLPTSGYTFERIGDSLYSASDLAGTVSFDKGGYTLTNTSTDAEIRLALVTESVRRKSCRYRYCFSLRRRVRVHSCKNRY